MTGAKIAAMTAVTAGRTGAMTEVTGGMTAATAVADRGCYGANSVRVLISEPTAVRPLSRATRA
jgi:hypothetical protein